MKPKQTLLLGLMLLVPVLGFLFLKTFGINRYALPTYLPDRVDSTLVGGEWQRDTVFHQLRDFQLPSQSGRLVTQQDLNGGVYVAGFFTTTTLANNRLMNNQLMRVQEQFRHEPRVKLVSYMLHTGGERDSLPALTRYAEQYGAIAGKWFFLTGDITQLQRLITQEYRLTKLEAIASSLAPTQQLFLVDRDKRVRGIYDGVKRKEVDRLITEISVLLYNYDHDAAARH